MNAGDQFLDVKRFGQVIIRAEVQPFEPLVEFAARRQQDDGQRHFPFAQIAENAQPILARQHDVEDRHVVRPRGCQRESLVAVMRNLNDEALRLQALADKRGDLLFVFDNQNFHRGEPHCLTADERR